MSCVLTNIKNYNLSLTAIEQCNIIFFYYRLLTRGLLWAVARGAYSSTQKTLSSLGTRTRVWAGWPSLSRQGCHYRSRPGWRFLVLGLGGVAWHLVGSRRGEQVSWLKWSLHLSKLSFHGGKHLMHQLLWPSKLLTQNVHIFRRTLASNKAVRWIEQEIKLNNN